MNQMELKDDTTIGDECHLFRRVPMIESINIVWDGNQNRWRPSSASFKDHRDGSPMSIVLGDELEKMGRHYNEILIGHDGFALAYITAGCARGNQQRVARDPIPSEPAHGVVIGTKNSASRKMAKAAVWVVPPTLTRPISL